MPETERVRDRLRTLRWQSRTVRQRILPGGRPVPATASPFNGQEVRLRTVRRLLDLFSPDAIVETGTYFGDTTRFFAGNLVPVYSVEVSRLFNAASKVLLAGTNDVHLIRGDSGDVVQRLVRERTFRRPLAYLDAHWYGRLPLRDEVEALLRCESSVAVIDDCRVPADPDYGFDDYGRFRIDIELLDGMDIAAGYPSGRARDETGARRGTLYLGHGDGRDALARAAAEDLITLV